ncbi:hypothetical protein [Undibacterium pigrum]|uniref:PilJ/NarX-like methyl-accepting chemotaxis transducer n=1 Tax=Undibacterium pigrum TaxID=401470 RepID=A0A318J1E1_9BURK|nr:hypothetical protein [Undibacterium pigrum]PXX41415.1 hypothetical protein DFR42_10766 [Undibacterium pigrum]
MRVWKKLVTLMLMCACASTNAGAHEINAYLAVSQEFEKITAEKTAQGRMPRLEDKGVAALISTLSDNKRFLNPASYQQGDILALMGMCTKTNEIAMSYALFDMKSHVKKGDDQAVVVQQIRKLMGTNIMAYQHELEQLHPFVIRCMATAVPLLTEFTAKLKPEEFTEVRRSGLQQARDGILTAYYGYLQAISYQELKQSFREKSSQALAEAAIPFASMIQPAVRKQIVDMATATQKNASGEIASNLRKIIDAMSATECTGLCKL